MIQELLTNNILLATVFSTILAQLIKTLIDSLYHGQFQFYSLFRGAGMPSSHTATVVALTISVFLTEGISTIFIVTLIFSLIVIRDVIWDKEFATHQENLINVIIKDIFEEHEIKRNHLIWHTSVEVFFGILVGITGTLVIFQIL